MPEPDRVVAGLSCREVLADLSDYIDGELPRARVARIEAHLAGCDWCERFGGAFSTVIRALRQHLAEATPLEESVADRLRARLDRELPAGA